MLLMQWSSCMVKPVSHGLRGSQSSTQGPTPRTWTMTLSAGWFDNTLIDARQPEHGSWLLSVVRNNRLYVGCKVCQKHADTIGRPHNKWEACAITGKSIKWSFVNRHSGMRYHQVAVAAMLGRPVMEVPRTTPSAESFQAVLVQKKRGDATSSLSTIAGIEKASRMSWRLGEAAKDIDKEHVRNALVIAIHQDARKGVLQVRFSCVGQNLQRHEGLLGLALDYGTTSMDTHRATLGVIREFCTKHEATTTSRSISAIPVQPDEVLFQNLKDRIELFVTDAASDEKCVGRFLAGKTNLEVDKLPNLKVVLCDRAHASTRRAHPMRPTNVDT